jgi:hypothetical protein
MWGLDYIINTFASISAKVTAFKQTTSDRYHRIRHDYFMTGMEQFFEEVEQRRAARAAAAEAAAANPAPVEADPISIGPITATTIITIRSKITLPAVIHPSEHYFQVTEYNKQLLLNININATNDHWIKWSDVRAIYRRLLLVMHPDHGGSSVALINLRNNFEILKATIFHTPLPEHLATSTQIFTTHPDIVWFEQQMEQMRQDRMRHEQFMAHFKAQIDQQQAQIDQRQVQIDQLDAVLKLMTLRRQALATHGIIPRVPLGATTADAVPPHVVPPPAAPPIIRSPSISRFFPSVYVDRKLQTETQEQIVIFDHH